MRTQVREHPRRFIAAPAERDGAFDVFEDTSEGLVYEASHGGDF